MVRVHSYVPLPPVELLAGDSLRFVQRTDGLLGVLGVHRRLCPFHGLLACLGIGIVVSGLLDGSPLKLAFGTVFGLAFSVVTGLDLAQPRTPFPMPVRLGLVVAALVLVAALLLATLG